LNTSQSFSSWLLDLHPKSDAQAPKSPDDLGGPPRLDDRARRGIADAAGAA
jgi:hypothetical protein